MTPLLEQNLAEVNPNKKQFRDDMRTLGRPNKQFTTATPRAAKGARGNLTIGKLLCRIHFQPDSASRSRCQLGFQFFADPDRARACSGRASDFTSSNVWSRAQSF